MTNMTIIAAGLIAVAMSTKVIIREAGEMGSRAKHEEVTVTQNSYVGMWVTEDGYVRHELLPNGRYDEARGSRKSAYQGRYTITGNHIDYVDDTGFKADGDFIDGVLHHGGMILRRER